VVPTVNHDLAASSSLDTTGKFTQNVTATDCAMTYTGQYWLEEVNGLGSWDDIANLASTWLDSFGAYTWAYSSTTGVMTFATTSTIDDSKHEAYNITFKLTADDDRSISEAGSVEDVFQVTYYDLCS
jgi:hypothetical protein